MWWQEGVTYQIYPRSLQDSDGDGVGDLRGIERLLDHVVALGAVWLSPVYPSPLADFGYDVADFEGIDPAFGTLEDFDRLLQHVHHLALAVLMDLVPRHTSIATRGFASTPTSSSSSSSRGTTSCSPTRSPRPTARGPCQPPGVLL